VCTHREEHASPREHSRPRDLGGGVARPGERMAVVGSAPALGSTPWWWLVVALAVVLLVSSPLLVRRLERRAELLADPPA